MKRSFIKRLICILLTAVLISGGSASAGQVIAVSALSRQVHRKLDPNISSVSLIAIGDMLMHPGVSSKAKQKDGTYNYDYLFKNIKADVQAADIAVLNNECIMGGNEKGIQGYPSFNIRTELGNAEIKAGFDVVNCATNHTMDMGTSGIKNTLNYWARHPEVTYLGINKSQKEQNTIRIVEKNGIRIAMLNFTYDLNGYRLPSGSKYLVNLMDSSTKSTIGKQLREAEELADFTIVFPHWGEEYALSHTSSQMSWAKYFIENGADLIIGTHSHCLEDAEWITSDNGDEGYCYFSLGNYCSTQTRTISNLGGMARVVITRDSKGTYLSSIGMDFLVNHFTGDKVFSAVYQYTDYTDALAKKHAITARGLSASKNKGYPMSLKGLHKVIEKTVPQFDPK